MIPGSTVTSDTVDCKLKIMFTDHYVKTNPYLGSPEDLVSNDLIPRVKLPLLKDYKALALHQSNAWQQVRIIPFALSKG